MLVPQAYFKNPWASPGGGGASNSRHSKNLWKTVKTFCYLVSKQNCFCTAVIRIGIVLIKTYFGLYLPYRVWRSRNPVLAALVQFFFINFHQWPPRTIWQGPRRPLHKWPFLKSAPDSRSCTSSALQVVALCTHVWLLQSPQSALKRIRTKLIDWLYCVADAVASGLSELSYWSNVCALSIWCKRRWQSCSCWRRRVFAGDKHCDRTVYVFQRRKENRLCKSVCCDIFLYLKAFLPLREVTHTFIILRYVRNKRHVFTNDSNLPRAKFTASTSQ